MSRAGLAALAVVLLAAGGGAAYYVQGPLRCQGLEEDYLNSVSSLRGAAAMRSLGSDAALLEAADLIEQQELDAIEKTLTALHTECGKRAANTAVRKGSSVLLGTD